MEITLVRVFVDRDLADAWHDQNIEDGLNSALFESNVEPRFVPVEGNGRRGEGDGPPWFIVVSGHI